MELGVWIAINLFFRNPQMHSDLTFDLSLWTTVNVNVLSGDIEPIEQAPLCCYHWSIRLWEPGVSKEPVTCSTTLLLPWSACIIYHSNKANWMFTVHSLSPIHQTGLPGRDCRGSLINWGVPCSGVDTLPRGCSSVLVTGPGPLVSRQMTGPLVKDSWPPWRAKCLPKKTDYGQERRGVHWVVQGGLLLVDILGADLPLTPAVQWS